MRSPEASQVFDVRVRKAWAARRWIRCCLQINFTDGANTLLSSGLAASASKSP
ncbi:hypothetical protein PISMIDRAFT_685720 [Pisolithus microcarpus 441]|uniref:Uncharacterized protein n=1 Tax=Pisolithus microcarpus 441 TaxID=765257 RepID=A0A0C9YSV0_9AGAM|nr:hypothetical protein PISMIDRAFT_685720 [Pisolithus microcarpus 441]